MGEKRSRASSSVSACALLTIKSYSFMGLYILFGFMVGLCMSFK